MLLQVAGFLMEPKWACTKLTSWQGCPLKLLSILLRGKESFVNVTTKCFESTQKTG